MLEKIKTKTKLQTVKEELNANAKSYGFGVLGSYEFKKILETKGFPIEREIVTYEVCNPKAAHDALSEFPEISSFLPCRVSVYSDGEETIISTINISVVLESIDVNKELEKHLQTVYDNLIKFMKSL